ncbi:MAG: hypothetical protein D6734_00825 [Candidatus Schekmanbacteria bacterium]|nr:MAG: hypothetical protein D6734_00825 [Candidatus Schekmanbacteria bacterium]
MKINIKKIVFPTVLIVISTFLLFHFPYEVFMDEFVSFADGAKLYSVGHFTHGYFCHGIINAYLVEISAYLSGIEKSFEVARFLNGIIGCLTIIGSYLLAREIFDDKTAFLSGIILLSSPYFVISSHRLLSDNPATLFFTLSLFAFSRYWCREDKRYLLLFSLCYGISVAAKLTTLPLLAPLVLLVLIQKKFKIRPFLKSTFQFFLLSLLAFFIIFPHTLIHFNYFLKDVFFYEFFRIDKGIDADPFVSQIPKTFLSGYKFYISELIALGFHKFILLIVLAGLVYLSIRMLWKRKDYLEQKKLILVIPLTFSFLFFGFLRNYYLRYIMPVFPLIAIISAGFFFQILEVYNERYKISLRLFQTAIASAMIVSLGINTGVIWKINEVKKRRIEFFELAKSIKRYAEKGDFISFDFLQGANFDSSLYGEPLGSYPLMMAGIARDIILINPLITAKPQKLPSLIITADKRQTDDSFVLIDEIKTPEKLRNEIINIEFNSIKRYTYLLEKAPYYIDEVSHFYEKRGGGFPDKFFIYQKK